MLSDASLDALGVVTGIVDVVEADRVDLIDGAGKEGGPLS